MPSRIPAGRCIRAPWCRIPHDQLDRRRPPSWNRAITRVSGRSCLVRTRRSCGLASMLFVSRNLGRSMTEQSLSGGGNAAFGVSPRHVPRLSRASVSFPGASFRTHNPGGGPASKGCLPEGVFNDLNHRASRRGMQLAVDCCRLPACQPSTGNRQPATAQLT